MATDFAVHKDDTFDSLSALVGITVPYRPVASTPPQQGGLIVDSASNSLYYSDGSTWIVVQGSVTSVCPVEIGINATAADAFATAVGCNAVAQSNGTAVGASSVADAYAIALGSGASSDSLSISMGYLAASIHNGITIGAQASTNAGISVGYEAVSNTGISIGSPSHSASGSIAIGLSSTASGLSSISIGSSSFATSLGATAVGYNSGAVNANTTVVGTGAVATFPGAVAVGSYAAGFQANTTALGSNAISQYANSVALGHTAAATVADQLALPSTFSIASGGPDTGSTVSFIRATVGNDNTAIPIFAAPVLMQGGYYTPSYINSPFTDSQFKYATYTSIGQTTTVCISFQVTLPTNGAQYVYTFSVPPGTTHANFVSGSVIYVGVLSYSQPINLTTLDSIAVFVNPSNCFQIEMVASVIGTYTINALFQYPYV